MHSISVKLQLRFPRFATQAFSTANVVDAKVDKMNEKATTRAMFMLSGSGSSESGGKENQYVNFSPLSRRPCCGVSAKNSTDIHFHARRNLGAP